MNTILKTIPFIFLSTILSCNTNKQALENNTNELSSNKTVNTQINHQGNSVNGTIVTGKENTTCDFLIQLKDGTLLDAINLEDIYKEKDTNINFTYTRLRMMNRCENANPISILKIKKI